MRAGGRYTLVAIPLGALAGTEGFGLNIVSHIEFVAGSDGGDPWSDVSLIIGASPAAQTEMQVSILDINRNVVATVKATQESRPNASELLAYLQGVPVRSQTIRAAADVVIDKPAHDNEFDAASPDRYVNTGKLYNETLKLRTHLSTQRAIDAVAAGFGSFSETMVKHVHIPLSRIRSVIASQLDVTDRLMMRALYGDDLPVSDAMLRIGDVETERLVGDAVTLRTALNKFHRMHLELPPLGQRIVSKAARNVVSEDALVANVNKRELNTLILAALKEPLIARRLGLVTRWRVAADLPEGDYFIRLEPAGMPPSVPATILDPRLTAFRVAYGSVSPRSLDPANKHHGAAWLTEGSRRRYDVTTVNPDVPVYNSFIQQNSNRPGSSLAGALSANSNQSAGAAALTHSKGVDDVAASANYSHEREPVRLPGKGLKEPHTTGVNFHAPIEDLARGDAPAPDSSDPYYLEDIWTGYRIDVRDKTSNGIFESLNVHHYTFSVGSGAANAVWFTEIGEDYEDREQLIDDKYVDTAFAGWTGVGKSQRRLLSDQTSVTSAKAIDGPFGKITEALKERHPRLVFGNDFTYRLRLVFQGGVSLDAADRILDRLPAATYEQSFKFCRSCALSPGDFIGLEDKPPKNMQASDRDIIVVEQGNGARTIDLAPRPLTWDEARFHGLVGFKESEKTTLRKRYIAGNLRALFQREGSRALYFCDPDVSAVEIVVTSVARNFDLPSESEVRDGVVCEIYPHGTVGRAVVKFGAHRKWEGYSPIRFRIVPTKAGRPSVKFSRNSLTIFVPPGDVLDVYAAPIIGDPENGEHSYAKIMRELMAVAVSTKSAAEASRSNSVYAPPAPHTALSAQYSDMIIRDAGKSAGVTLTADVDRKNKSTKPEAFASLKESVAGTALGISEKRFRIIHPALKPSLKPQIRTLSLSRKAEQSAGYLDAIISVDAATSESGRWILSWRETDDKVDQSAPVSLQSTVASEGARSIIFEENQTPTKDDVLKSAIRPTQLAECQRAENTLVFSGSASLVGGKAGLPAKFEFRDGRYRKVTAAYEVRSRFGGQRASGAGGIEASDPRTVDLPNVIVPPEPHLSHIVPIIRRDTATDASGRTTVRDDFALRIYLHRPWVLTGEGERLAIGCTSTDTEDLWRYVTRWGEDPFERPKLAATLRYPRAADFGAPDPEKVAYFDDITLQASAAASLGIGPRRPTPLALASFETAYHKDSELWYADVLIKPKFFGWIGLALYRHQPISDEGFHISKEPVFAYMARLQEEIVTYYLRDGFLRIIVGPTADSNASYDVRRVRKLSSGIYEPIDEDAHAPPGSSFSAFQTPEGRMVRMDVLPDGSSFFIRKTKLGNVQHVIAIIDGVTL